VHPLCRMHDTKRDGTVNFIEFEKLHNFLTSMQVRYLLSRTVLTQLVIGHVACTV